jgi:hypothetical protein
LRQASPRGRRDQHPRQLKLLVERLVRGMVVVVLAPALMQALILSSLQLLGPLERQLDFNSQA